MATYKLYLHYGHPRKATMVQINARNMDEFRRTAIKRYSSDLMDRHFGNSVYGHDSTYIGQFDYQQGVWMWNPTKNNGFVIDPSTGGKAQRYEKGYDVKGTTASGKKLDTHFSMDGIDFLRSILMNQSNYGDHRAGTFNVYKDGKKIGRIQMGSNGRWVWESASGARYYLDIQGKLSSQIKRGY